jgi:hypothetical protein
LPWLPAGPRALTITDLAAAAEEALRLQAPLPTLQTAGTAAAAAAAAGTAVQPLLQSLGRSLEAAVQTALRLQHTAYLKNRDDRSSSAMRVLLSLYEHPAGRRAINALHVRDEYPRSLAAPPALAAFATSSPGT